MSQASGNMGLENHVQHEGRGPDSSLAEASYCLFEKVGLSLTLCYSSGYSSAAQDQHVVQYRLCMDEITTSQQLTVHLSQPLTQLSGQSPL